MATKDKKTKKSSEKNGNADGAYLTKRILVRAARKGFREAAAETMAIQGFNIIAEDGWVVKVYADGKREKIKEIKRVNRPSKIILD